MITLNITPEGEITISQETPEERTTVSEHYTGQEDVSQETIDDEERSAFFKSGWDAAIKECMLNFANGRIVDFFIEMGMEEAVNQDPHHEEPEGTGEVFDGVPAAGWADEQESRFAANEVGIRPVADSGEPEKEMNQTWDPQNEGTWTMSSDELQSRLDAAYQRGYEQKKSTTHRALGIIALEINNQVLQGWDEEQSQEQSDLRQPISKGEYAHRFANLLAVRLGYEVSA